MALAELEQKLTFVTKYLLLNLYNLKLSKFLKNY